jgi:hypothetical protein
VVCSGACLSSPPGPLYMLTHSPSSLSHLNRPPALNLAHALIERFEKLLLHVRIAQHRLHAPVRGWGG